MAAILASRRVSWAWSWGETALNLSRQTQAFWREILGNTSPGPVPDPCTQGGRHLLIGLKATPSALCCSALRHNFYEQPSAAQPREAMFQRAASPVFGERQRLQLESLRRPYWIECISCFVTYANEMWLRHTRSCARWRNIRFTPTQLLRSSLDGALRTRLRESPA